MIRIVGVRLVFEHVGLRDTQGDPDICVATANEIKNNIKSAPIRPLSVAPKTSRVKSTTWQELTSHEGQEPMDKHTQLAWDEPIVWPGLE